MELKNNNVFVGLICIIIGIFIGWLIWGMQSKHDINGMHQMPDGTMMTSSGSNMESMMHDMNAALVGKTGDEFDKTFLSEMIVHHQGAVDMAKLVLVQSKRPELIKLANDIITAQNSEIDMMKGWQMKWFK